MNNKTSKQKLHDIIGIGCGLFLVVVLVASIVLGGMASSAGAKAGDIPSDAVTLSGTAPGRNGDVAVEVIATADKIYQVKVTDQKETDGIGSVAVDQLPGAIYEAQSLSVDGISGATITSDAIKAAIANALSSGGLDASAFGSASANAGGAVASNIAKKVETGSAVTVLHASDWEAQYPEIVESWRMTKESAEAEDYLEIYPMLRTLYEPYGFAKDYKAARGHYYDVDDIAATGRPHPLANCWTCKTPDFTAMVNEMGDEAYQLSWEDVKAQVNEGISCYTCHANTPGEITITHTYWIDAMGDDFEKVAPANLACGQCHNEYYFDPISKATTIAHNSLESMAPDAMLATTSTTSIPSPKLPPSPTTVWRAWPPTRCWPTSTPLRISATTRSLPTTPTLAPAFSRSRCSIRSLRPSWAPAASMPATLPAPTATCPTAPRPTAAASAATT